ncbi:MAG: carboxymuconolactone decarboxylase family protein [Dehalococcoidia bacterium]|nr:carboxymuconolactone decarboxylase family protein [Dehalococcoidia bacterium]
MSRLTPLDMDRLTPDQQRVVDAIVSGPRGGMRGPFESMLRSPGLADTAQKLGAHIRFGTVLPRDISELAIMMTGKFWRASFEFWAHARLAAEAGVSAEVIDALRLGSPPPFTDPRQRLVYAFVRELLDRRRVSDSTYARVLEEFGEQGVVDLVGTVGYYSLVSMTLEVFEVKVPEGENAPF